MVTGNQPARGVGLELEAFRALTEHSPDVIMVLDTHGEIQFINWTAPGLSADQVVGTPVYAYVAPDQHAEMRACFEQVKTTGRPGTYRNVYEVPGGSKLEWESRVAPIVVDSAVVGFTVFSRDVTERNERAAELDRFFELSVDFICIASNGYFKRVNPAFARALGYTNEELMSSPINDFVHPDDVEALVQGRERLAEGKSVVGFENRYRTKAGEYRLLAWQAIADRERNRSIGVARDITEQRALEMQLRQSQKMDAVGQLAGGIAHDFNNLVLAVLGNAEFALRGLRSDQDDIRTHLEEIERAGQRAAALTRQLLAFSRRTPLSVQGLDPNALIENLLKMLRRLIPEDIRLVWRPGEGVPPVAADSGQLEQVLMNLCVNARDAMPGGGELTIETRVAAPGERVATPGEQLPPEGEVVLVVADTGCGMDPAVKERIFEPFFSTKGPSKGTGLGLATVYAIVKRHGGRIDVTSEVDGGTVCKVFLPAARLGASSAVGSSEPQRPSGGRGGATVLIAEDEELVRNVLVRMFERAGYRVLAATNGREAVTLLEQHRDEVRFALLDVVMPELSGPEAYERLVLLRPDLPALFISGYADDSRAATRIPPGVRLLEKPVSADVLLGAVETLLAERR